MNPINIIILALILLLNSCSNKNSEVGSARDTLTAAAIDSEIYNKELSDLRDFPKDWVMVTNLSPDSIIGNYVVMFNADSQYYGSVNIVPENGHFNMIVKDYLVADRYEIISCKKVMEAEMVYYNFELQMPDKTIKKLQVNYRENSDNPQSSAWFFGEIATGEEIMEFVSKKLSPSFKANYNEE